MTENTVPDGLSASVTLARCLANKRKEVHDVRAQIEKAEMDLKKLKSYQAIEGLKADLRTLQTEQAETEGKLRETALEVAVELKIKDPAPGVTITKRTTFTIVNQDTALEACRETYPQLIEEKIKKTELKKIVVALGEAIAGTTLTENEYGQVKIATDLGKHYLEDENDVPF